MPFINTIFSELTTLGFIGLILFVITKLHILSTISHYFFHENEKLQETIENLHMGLFFFILIFLSLCCILLRRCMRLQAQWREYERHEGDLPVVISDYVLATERPRNRIAICSLKHQWTRENARQEMIFLALRRRFVDVRSNHPNSTKAFQYAKEFQVNSDIRFPFHEYLAILAGESMSRLIEIDPATWLAMEVFLVGLFLLCWNVGNWAEIWVLIVFGYALAAVTFYIAQEMQRMRQRMVPQKPFRDAERLRRKTEWRVQYNLNGLVLDESSKLLCTAELGSEGIRGDPWAPPYVHFMPKECMEFSEHQLAKYQRTALFHGHKNGAKIAVFSIRLVVLLLAMHLAIFILRSGGQIYRFYGAYSFIVYLLYLAPSIFIMHRTPQIARDAIYAFSVEHLKSSRVIAKVMRILKARQTLRTLRFVAEMKIHLRETAKQPSRPSRQHPVVLPPVPEVPQESQHVPPSRRASRRGSIGPTTLEAARRLSIIADMPTSDIIKAEDTSPIHSQPLSPLVSYVSSKNRRRGDKYKLEAERREIHTIFCLFDIDASGYVSRDEMANLLLAITHDLNEHQLNRLINELITDPAQQEVSFDAFYNWCHQQIHDTKHSKEELIAEIFCMVDTDRSGYITVDEFITVFKTLGQSLDHDDVRELVYQMDRNEDGKIDLEEFTKMLQKHEV